RRTARPKSAPCFPASSPNSSPAAASNSPPNRSSSPCSPSSMNPPKRRSRSPSPESAVSDLRECRVQPLFRGWLIANSKTAPVLRPCLAHLPRRPAEQPPQRPPNPPHQQHNHHHKSRRNRSRDIRMSRRKPCQCDRNHILPQRQA